jgi:hypothetical protein
VAAGEPVPSPLPEADSLRAVELDFFPDAELYPQYIADPIRSQSAVMLTRVSSSDIPHSGDRRFSLRLGGRFPIARLHPHGDSERGLQLDFEGGFFGIFDLRYSLDNIGWDGLVGLALSYRTGPKLAFRIATLHDSAHVGDEYAERTGRTRIQYTREEIAIGVSWTASPQWRAYAEAACSYGTKTFQQRLRAQAGAEYRGAKLPHATHVSWYGALDLRAYQENDWRPRVTGQLGLLIPTPRGTGRYRLALEVARGRSVLGEFFHENETYAGIGWYFDF